MSAYELTGSHAKELADLRRRVDELETLMTERAKPAEGSLLDAHVLLEKHIKERTAELRNVIRTLRLELAERERRDEALRRGEHQLKAIFDHAFQFIGLMSPDGTLLRANQTSLKAAGVRESDVIGLPFWETGWWAHSPEQQERLREAVARAAAGEVDRFEATHPTPEGDLIVADFSLTPVKDDTGTVVLLIPEGRDITDRKRAEEAHRMSEERFELAVRGTHDGLWDWDIRTGKEWWSPRLFELLGHEPGDIEATYATMIDAVHPDDREITERAVKAHIEHRAEFDIEVRLRTNSGTYRWFRVRGQAQWDADDLAVRMAGSIQDVQDRREAVEALAGARDELEHRVEERTKALQETIAELRRTQASLQEAHDHLEQRVDERTVELVELQAARDRFYAMVNHELRNALTGVYGWAEMLVRHFGEDPPRPAVETMESAEYALEMLNDLLDLSRLDADRIEPEITSVDASDVAHDAVKTVQPSADEADIVILLEGADAPLRCRTDGTRIRQTLVNLLRNAIRHSGSEDVILAVSADETTLRFDVIDHGLGISPEQQEVIFDAFERAVSKVGGGTGLGLTLCRKLVRLLDGTITVDSQLGEGSKFTVQIARELNP